MNQLLPLDIEYVTNEKVDIVFDNVLFTNIIANDLGKKKPKDLLPLIGFIEADLELRNHRLTGVNRHIYYSEIKTELNRLVLCN
jgi:hypothetical protein